MSRKQFLEKKAEYYAEFHYLKQESAVKALLHEEQTKKEFWCIKYAMDNKAVKKLSSILIPRKYNNFEDAYNAIKMKEKIYRNGI